MDEVLYSWTEQVDPQHTALVLVDVQNDFVHPDGWVFREQIAAYVGDTGIPAALDATAVLLGAARAVRLPVVFVRMIGDERYLSGPMRARYRDLHGSSRPVCVAEGTWGAELYGDLRPDGRPGEFVVDKHRYSAFIGTRLDTLLRSHRIATLVVAGVATSGCVESTIRDGFMHDYYVVTAGDACADYDEARHRASLSKVSLSFGHVVPAAEIAALWARSLTGIAASAPMD